MTAPKNLSEYSTTYYEKPEIYDLFSQAEDCGNKIFSLLLPELKGKSILDAGCGTGKYLELFASHVGAIVGVDASEAQLTKARKRTKRFDNVQLVHSDLEHFDAGANRYDAAIACWVMGTILDEEKRLNAIRSIERTLTPGGQFFLIENDAGGEFEHIRNRVNDPLQKTQNYNSWLVDKVGFNILNQLDTEFAFESTEEAKRVFDDIWGAEAASRVNSKKIEHKVVIFRKWVNSQ